jgi:N-acetylglucosaminyldiphosphoundecaprenol N-acetyl-beta-D-mannosaminyltransferase
MLQKKHGKVDVLGVQVDCLNLNETDALIEQMVSSGQAHFVATADTAGIAQAQDNPDLMSLYAQADLVTPDSLGVVWALKRRGKKQERITGVDLACRMMERGSTRDWTFFFLGAAPGVAALAAEKAAERWPGLKVVGTRDGFFKPEQDEEVAAEIAKLNPDFLLVAMGIPRQEQFILKTKHIIKARVAIGVGGTLDVLSGTVKRAPVIIQKLKLEWLWRTLANPKKISKAANLPRFVMYELKSKRGKA